ncbi:MAG: SiaB family protein kinase [Bacteroidota bacterium]
MTNPADFFTALPGESTMLTYKGRTEDPIPDSVYSELEEKLNATEDVKSRKKRFFYIAVECMQNVIRHQEGARKNGAPAEPVMVMAFMLPGDHYRIVTGNHMNAINATALKKQLDDLKSMDAEQLHSYYLAKLSGSSISEKGGAGLGLIDIARKSENNIKYNFSEEDPTCFFTFEVTVK